MEIIKRKMKSHPALSAIYKILVTLVASVLIIAGILMLVLPGPGILVILLGLGLLGTEYPWAHKIVVRLKFEWSKMVHKFRTWQNRKNPAAISATL